MDYSLLLRLWPYRTPTAGLALPLTPDQLTAVRHRMAENYAAMGYEKGCVGEVLHSLAAYAQALITEPQFN